MHGVRHSARKLRILWTQLSVLTDSLSAPQTHGGRPTTRHLHRDVTEKRADFQILKETGNTVVPGFSALCPSP